MEPDLTIAGHPDILVIGDMASFSHRLESPLPAVAPVAIQQGQYAARLIRARLASQDPAPVSLPQPGNACRDWAQRGSGRSGVDSSLRGSWPGCCGFLIHIVYLIEFDNKVLIMFRWIWNYFTRKRGVRLITDATREASQQTRAQREMTNPCRPTRAPRVQPTTSAITMANRWDHILARWGVNRSGHRVEPGLYALGSPAADSPVFVTANYTLSFDALRSALPGVTATSWSWTPRASTSGARRARAPLAPTSWCSASRPPRLRTSSSHRTLILPQLGAPGVSAHEVKRRTGLHGRVRPRARGRPARVSANRAGDPGDAPGAL